jgi:hypothetical protein
MKLTKKQLRRIIKEEQSKLLSEQGSVQTLVERLYSTMNSIYGQYRTYGDLDEQAAADKAVETIIDEVNGFLESIGRPSINPRS